MISYKTLGGFSLEKLPYQEMYESFDDPNLTKYDLGESVEGRPIPAFSIGNPSNPTLFIFNLHGAHEWRCPYWIYEFARKVANEDSPYHNPTFKIIKQHFHLFVIPTVNPDGYENGTRFNANGVDLNRNFDNGWAEYDDSQYSGTKGSHPFSEPESEIIRSIVEDLKPILFVDCHTAGGSDHAIYEIGSYRHELLFRDTVKSLTMTSLFAPAGIAMDNFRPKAAAWGGKQIGRLGSQIMSTAIEAGEQMPHEDQTKEGMDMLYILILNAMHYYRTHNLILN